MKSSKTLIIAHRGASKICPENTLKAFRKAIELKADYIEFDVQKSKDDELVVIHDEDTLRTTGVKGLINNMTLKEIKKLDAGEGEQIPTLEEVIDLTAGKIGLNCEIKVAGIGERVVEVFKKEGILDSVMISSFLHDELIKIKKMERSVTIASLEPSDGNMRFTTETKKQMVQFVEKNQFQALNLVYSLVDKQLVQWAHEKNIKIIPWTVDTKIGMKRLLKLGVDGIITNDVELLKEVLRQYRST
ncbi:MAG: glycerophosphodiester phosphodiesterase [Promethearchaeota archaeon]